MAVIKQVQKVLSAKPCKRIATSHRVLFQSFFSMSIICFSFFGIGKHFVGGSEILEFPRCFGVVFVFVGMQFFGLFTVSLFNLIRVGTSGNSENFIKVSPIEKLKISPAMTRHTSKIKHTRHKRWQWMIWEWSTEPRINWTRIITALCKRLPDQWPMMPNKLRSEIWKRWINA